MKEEIRKILMRNFTKGDIEKATNELFDMFYIKLLLSDTEKVEYDPNEPYMGWCDVENCGNEGASGGCCWSETGYWTICSQHARQHSEGKPQPSMKQSAIDREKTRGADGVLP